MESVGAHVVQLETMPPPPPLTHAAYAWCASTPAFVSVDMHSASAMSQLSAHTSKKSKTAMR